MTKKPTYFRHHHLPPIEIPEPTNLQDAIDLAVKEEAIISFPCQLSNKEIREADVDWKECTAFKGTRESKTVSVSLQSIQDEIFG